MKSELTAEVLSVFKHPVIPEWDYMLRVARTTFNIYYNTVVV